jgi:hypothetical protein
LAPTATSTLYRRAATKMLCPLRWRGFAITIDIVTTDEVSMCRNIKTLFNFDPPVTGEEIRAASLQFVRKISGFSKPSKANEGSFLAAVDQAESRLVFSVRSKRTQHRRIEKKRPQKRKLAPRRNSVVKSIGADPIELLTPDHAAHQPTSPKSVPPRAI